MRWAGSVGGGEGACKMIALLSPPSHHGPCLVAGALAPIVPYATRRAHHAALSDAPLEVLVRAYAMRCDAMLCYAMLCYAMRCDAMRCDAMLCYAMLCYARAPAPDHVSTFPIWQEENMSGDLACPTRLMLAKSEQWTGTHSIA